MFILEFLAKLVKILRSAASPGQIAGGFILGMIIGLTPLWSLHNLLILLLIIILNVNISMAILGFVVFSGIAYLFDPLFHNLGFLLLADIESLRGLWTAMYNVPVIALSRFNNTLVLGSLISAIILLAPIYFLSKKSVLAYRESVDPWFQKLKIVKALKGTKVYGIYEKYSDWS